MPRPPSSRRSTRARRPAAAWCISRPASTPPARFTCAATCAFTSKPGATVYSSKDRASFDKHALFYAEEVENITLEGRGTVDGQAEYVHRLHDMQDWYIYPNQSCRRKPACR